MKKIIDETKRQRKNRCVACCRFVCSRIFYYSLALFFPFSGRKNKNKVLRRKIFRETFWLFFYFWTFLFLFPRFSCLIAGDAQGKYESFPSFYLSLFRALLSLFNFLTFLENPTPLSLFLPFGPRFIIFHLRFFCLSLRTREKNGSRDRPRTKGYTYGIMEKKIGFFFYVIEFPIRSTFSHDCSLARSFVLARLVYPLLFFVCPLQF